MPIIISIFKVLGTKVIADTIIGLVEIIAKRTDNSIDDEIASMIEDVVNTHVKKM